MKKQMITMMAAMFLATLTVTAVHAQNAGQMAVNIPFDFSISGKILPAGEYYVRRKIEGPRVALQISARNKTQSVYLPQTHLLQSTDIQSVSKLLFNRYGDQFFLSEVWFAGRSVGEQLTKTSRERLLRRDIAKRMEKSESIAIAGRVK